MIDRLRANEWKFAGVLPQADRALAVAWWTLLLVRGILPAVEPTPAKEVRVFGLVDWIVDGFSARRASCSSYDETPPGCASGP